MAMQSLGSSLTNIERETKGSSFKRTETWAKAGEDYIKHFQVRDTADIIKEELDNILAMGGAKKQSSCKFEVMSEDETLEVDMNREITLFYSEELALDKVKRELLRFKVKPSCYCLFFCTELNGFALRQILQNGEPISTKLEGKTKVTYPFVIKSESITAKFEKQEEKISMTVFDYSKEKKRISFINKLGCIISPRKLPDLKIKLDSNKGTININSRSKTKYYIEARTIRISEKIISFADFELYQV